MSLPTHFTPTHPASTFSLCDDLGLFVFIFSPHASIWTQGCLWIWQHAPFRHYCGWLQVCLSWREMVGRPLTPRAVHRRMSVVLWAAGFCQWPMSRFCLYWLLKWSIIDLGGMRPNLQQRLCAHCTERMEGTTLWALLYSSRSRKRLPIGQA